MKFSVYQESNIGGRAVNQDRMGYSFTRDALFLVLADGMGGHLHGEIAANIAVRALGAQFQRLAQPYIRKPQRFLEDSFLAAHNEICTYTDVHRLPESPRTTLVACLIQHNNAYWAHSGDSRLYWMRDGHILSRTRDHSKIEQMIAAGRATPDERKTHPERNKLYNCLGSERPPVIDISRGASLKTGDTLLLCSDGLWSSLSDEIISEALQDTSVVKALPDLIKAALLQAGKHSDNVTALGLNWLEENEADFHPMDDELLVTTQSMPANEFQSTINWAPIGEPSDTPELAGLQVEEQADDFDIEKAIAEIRGAIEKNNF